MKAFLSRVIRLAQSSPCIVFNRLSSSKAAPKMDPFQAEDMQSKLILVDENDKMIGWDTKYNCHLVRNGKIPLHRAFSVFIFNSKKELLMQQRSPAKVTFPMFITNSCCSHPLYEPHVEPDTLKSMRLPVFRRLSFELGIPSKYHVHHNAKFITKIHYFSEGDGTWGEHEIDYIFVMYLDVPELTPNPLEVNRVWSVARADFDYFIDNLEYPLTPWFEHIKKDWLPKIWNNLDDLSAIRDDEIHKFG